MPVSTGACCRLKLCGTDSNLRKRITGSGWLLGELYIRNHAAAKTAAGPKCGLVTAAGESICFRSGVEMLAFAPSLIAEIDSESLFFACP